MRKNHLPPQDVDHVFCPQCNYNLTGQPSEPAEWPVARAWCPSCRREFTVDRKRKGATTFTEQRPQIRSQARPFDKDNRRLTERSQASRLHDAQPQATVVGR
jgi:ssDNA-binding Zn-finger/Zn-ribbon topoisomerase 1